MAGFAPSFGQNASGQYDFNGTSGDPSKATNYFPTKQAAEDSWYAANPGYSRPGGSASGQSQGQSQPPSALQPTYLSQLFPNGLPQASASTVGGVPQINAPQAAYSGDVSAQNVNGAGPVSATNAIASLLGPGASTSDITRSIMSALEPQFAQQQRGLTEGLANAGIVGGSTTGAVGALGLQQQEQSLAQMAPYILQGLQMQQQRDLSNQGSQNETSRFNAGLDTQTATSNRDAANQVGEFNSSQSLAAQSANQAARDQVAQYNAGLGFNAQAANQGTALAGSEFNAGVQNASDQFNIGNQIRGGMFDIGNQMAAQSQLANIQNQDYLTQLGLRANVVSAGQGATAGAYQPIFQQPAPSNYGGLASAIASGLAPRATANSGAPVASPQSGVYGFAGNG